MVHHRLFSTGSGFLVRVSHVLCILLQLSMTSLESRGIVSSLAAACDVEDRDANLPIAGRVGLSSDMQHRGQISSDRPTSDLS